MNAAFVAEARRVYVPAVAWWKEQGGEKHLYRGWGNSTKFTAVAIDIEIFEVTDRAGADCTRMTVAIAKQPDDVQHPTSITNAVDRLVVAGVLPPQFASWGQYVPATDFDGEKVGVFLDAPGQTESLWFMDADEDKPDGWHQLYRRLPAQQAASVTA